MKFSKMNEMIFDELKLEYPIKGTNAGTPKDYCNIAIFQVYDGDECFKEICSGLDNSMQEIKNKDIEGIVVDIKAVKIPSTQMVLTLRLWREFEKHEIEDGYVGLFLLEDYLRSNEVDHSDFEPDVPGNEGIDKRDKVLFDEIYKKYIKPTRVYESIEDAVIGVSKRLKERG